jgi:fibronectin type 3 domain-containing protein
MKKYLWARLGGLLAVCLLAACPTEGGEEEQKPEIPTGVSVSVEPSGIRVSWNPVKGTSVYIVYRRDGSTGNGAPIREDIGSTNSNHIDTTGTAGQAYSYAVAARNDAGTSDKSLWSEEKGFPADFTVKPVQPANVEAAAQSSTAITITWPGIPNATGYKVYRTQSSGGEFSLISGTAPWAGTSYTDVDLTPNKDYFYQVTALNTSGESVRSDTVSAKTETGGGGSANIDWTSYTEAGSYVFRVRNNTNKRLVAFRRNLTSTNLIGGVDSSENEHGFKKDSNIFGSTSQDFPLIFITEEQYNANATNLAVLEKTPFTRIYAYYNAVGTNETVYEINEGLGGEYTLQVTPSIQWNAELRLSGVHGTTLGYVTKEQYDTSFKMNTGFYQVFPVVRQYNAFRNQIVSFYPKWSDGSARSVGVGLDAENHTAEINIHELLQGVTMSTGSAFIIVDNQSSSGVQLFGPSNIAQMTSTGSNFVNTNRAMMFQVNMVQLDDNKYAEKQSISAYKIGSNLNNAALIGDVELYVDKVYRVTIKGNTGGFQITGPVDEGVMSLSD